MADRMYRQRVWSCNSCPSVLKAPIEGYTTVYFCKAAQVEDFADYPRQLFGDIHSSEGIPDWCPLPLVEAGWREEKPEDREA